MRPLNVRFVPITKVPRKYTKTATPIFRSMGINKKEQMSIPFHTFLLARLPIGMSMLGHGLVRIPKFSTFAEGMATSFEQSILPHSLVLSFAYVLPFVELAIGLCILAGLFTRPALVAGVVLMCVLIFGSSLTEQWQGVAIQMFYGAYFALLYRYTGQYNHHSLDKRLAKFFLRND